MSSGKKNEENSTPDEDKAQAQVVLEQLCVGAQIDGIRFGPVLQLLITDHDSLKPRIEGQVYLNLASHWMIFEQRPILFPESVLSEPDVDEQLRQLCTIRELHIIGVELGLSNPHLIITLEGGKVFYLNGQSDDYEPWQLGVAFSKPGEIWMVVALPYGGIAVWAPQNIINSISPLATS